MQVAPLWIQGESAQPEGFVQCLDARIWRQSVPSGSFSGQNRLTICDWVLNWFDIAIVWPAL
jgi:hypothetical protein